MVGACSLNLAVLERGLAVLRRGYSPAWRFVLICICVCFCVCFCIHICICTRICICIRTPLLEVVSHLAVRIIDSPALMLQRRVVEDG